MTGNMPTFVIKAKDLLAPEAVKAYWELCVKYHLHDQAEQVLLALDEIILWQQDNKDAVKLPDHAHVPAAAPAVAEVAGPSYRAFLGENPCSDPTCPCHPQPAPAGAASSPKE